MVQYEIKDYDYGSQNENCGTNSNQEKHYTYILHTKPINIQKRSLNQRKKNNAQNKRTPEPLSTNFYN